uniref:Uncharacterized protein n=1 Tax=Rhizophora mucronata TaxID=61149 RepID=A0A2P2IIW7_RHIMU
MINKKRFVPQRGILNNKN